MDHMNQMGMALLTVALEVSRDEMNKFPSILSLIKDDMCRHLFQVTTYQPLTNFKTNYFYLVVIKR